MDTVEKNVSCVFVRNISFELDKQTVEDAFGEIGPVRNCFLVKEKGQDRHKGIGFVHFAIPEDADRAVAALNNTTLGTRKILVEHAIKRAPLADRKRKRIDAAVNSTATKPAQLAPSVDGFEKLSEDGSAKLRLQGSARRTATQAKRTGGDKHRLACTVALGNLSKITKDAAIVAAQAAGKVLNITDPAPAAEIDSAKLRNDGCTGELLFCEYDTVSSALAAVAQLHGLPLQLNESAGVRKRETLSQSASSTDTGQRLWARQVGGEGAHVKACRVIVRNLPFQVTETAVQAAFRPAGFVWELTLPRSADGKSRGFAFVGFTCRADAERAISLMNGQKLDSRVVAVDWAVAKSLYQPAEDQEVADKLHSGVNMRLPVPDAVIAVRKMSIPFQEEDDSATAGPQEELAMQRSVLDTLMQTEPEIILTSSLPPTEDQLAPTRSTSLSADASVLRGGAASKTPAVPVTASHYEVSTSAAAKARSTCGHTQRTVFVRGLPAGTSQQQLHAAMLNFGTVKSCRLVMNQTLKKPKGTAFVEFSSGAGAAKAAAACKRHRDGVGPGVVVNGKSVDVDEALTQDDARAMAAQQGDKHGPEDRRRLYLANEGNIEQGTAAWEDMSAQDQQRRKRGIQEKNTKLRSPNFFVSPHRLSVRNLPLTLGEAKLKELMIQAVKERAVTARPHIKQVKILREAGKLGKDGKPLSKGLGFVEFVEHEHALCALRQLNNNPRPFGKERRPIVEFAIESVDAVKKREQRLQQQRGNAGVDAPEPHAAHAQAQPSRRASCNDSHRKQLSIAESLEEATIQQPGTSAGPPKKRPRRDGQNITAGAPTRTRSMLRRPAATRRTKPVESGDRLDTLVGTYKKQFLSMPSQRPQVDRRWFD